MERNDARLLSSLKDLRLIHQSSFYQNQEVYILIYRIVKEKVRDYTQLNQVKMIKYIKTL